jgi:hypothetical protein
VAAALTLEPCVYLPLAGSCPLGIASDAISTTVPVLSPVVFTAATNAASKEKLRVVFNPAARTSNFIKKRADASFQVKLMSISSDSSVFGTFSWKFEEDVYFQPETTIAASASEAGARALSWTAADGSEWHTGVFVFFEPTFKGSSAFTGGETAANDLYTFALMYNDGSNFDEGDSNTAHQERECSGRGSCDSVSGKCACPVGYTGVACERSE